MAVLITPYTDINATMRGIRTQVLDSLDYCKNEMPRFNNPAQMWNVLKQMVIYKNDPAGVELLQSVPTLFENNYWKKRGSGDCDCFSILVLAMCAVHGWKDQKIVLAGRTKQAPVHIWTQVKFKGKWYDMDLTQPFFNTTRHYKYCQYLDC
jgi:transglutaminase-like putative cysteine protease